MSSTAVESLEEAPPARLELFDERARSIVSGNDSPDIAFRWSVNPYRGCIHGCAYLRLPVEVRPVFDERIAEAFPDRAQRIDHAIVELRRGRKNHPRFGTRVRGNGPRWDAIVGLFEAQCRRLGMNQAEAGEDEGARTFRRPTRQGSLFGD